MQYHIFLLKFLTPVHFGNTANGGALDKVAINCSADTLFAALCNEAAAQEQSLWKLLYKSWWQVSWCFPVCYHIGRQMKIFSFICPSR